MVRVIASIFTVIASTPALAQASPEALGAGLGQTCFHDFTARTEMQRNGQRLDATHATRDQSFLETRNEDFNVVFGIEQA